MTSTPLERSYSLEVAETALKSELDKLGYHYEFQIAGELIYTAKCTLTAKRNGAFLASGNGKGELIASRVGSLFEATEHLFSHYYHIGSEKIFHLDSSDFCRNNHLCNKLPLATLQNSKSALMPFLKYNAVNGTEECFYPLGLSCPDYLDLLVADPDLRKHDSFNYQRLEQYSTNSGTAIGMNREEAIIHGLLESIERTSLSDLLTRSFLLNEAGQLRVVNSQSMPSNITAVFVRIEKEIGSKVYIFEMPNKFGVPAYCSWMQQDHFKIGIAGYGCSLSVEHAILRSLYELAQYFLLSKHVFGYAWLTAKSESTLTQLTGLPLHQDCARFNLASKCATLGFEIVDYQKIPKIQFNLSLEEYLAQLTDIIYSKGEIPFASELNSLGNGINIMQTFITGEDRFFNVQHGKSTFPVSLER